MKYHNKFVFIVFAAIMVTGVCMLAYAETQFVLRSSANDPQIELAHEYASLIGANGQTNFNNQQVDIAQSLSTFYMVTDAGRMPTATNLLLDGKVPTIPEGIFKTAKDKGENRVSWEPKKGVRMALVVVPITGMHDGFVVVGRSLKEVEHRESQAFRLAVMAEIALLIVAVAGIYLTVKN